LSLKLHNANSVLYRTESNSIVEEIYNLYREGSVSLHPY